MKEKLNSKLTEKPTQSKLKTELQLKRSNCPKSKHTNTLHNSWAMETLKNAKLPPEKPLLKIGTIPKLL